MFGIETGKLAVVALAGFVIINAVIASYIVAHLV